MINLNKTELEYIREALSQWSDYDEGALEKVYTREVLIKIHDALEVMDKEYENLDKTMAFLALHPYFETENYTFISELDNPGQIMYPAVDVSGGFIDDFIMVSSKDEMDTCLEIEYQKANHKYGAINVNDSLRFCDICGSPMEKGFTDESMYICSDMEFYNHMNQTYPNGWRPATEEEVNQCDANFMYYDIENDHWEPMEWYWTEWYD